MNTATTSAASTSESKTINGAFWQNFRLQLALLLLLVGIQYGNTLRNGYVCDDKMVIEMNDFTQAGFKGLPKIWTQQSLAGFFKDDKRRVGDYWRPIPLSIFAIEHQLFPKKPGFAHFINLLIYGGLVALAFAFLKRRLFPDKPILAFMVAILFALHPIHTEVAGNIKGRDEMLTLIFLLFSMDNIFKYVENNKQKDLAVALGAYLCALLCKENALAFLGVIPITLFFFTRLSIPRIATILGFLVATAGVYLSYRYAVVGMGLTQEGQDVLTWSDPVYNRFAYTNVADKYATVVYMLGFYLSLLFFPSPLSWDYSFRQIPFYTWSDPVVWLSLAVNIALIVWALIGLRNKSLYTYGIAFYFLTLFLVSNLVVDIGGFVGERFLFQPSFGFAIVIGAALYDFIERGKFLPAESRPQIALGFLGIVGLLWTGKTIHRNDEWKSDEILFRADAKSCPNSIKTNYALGTHLLALAQTAPDTPTQIKMLEEAETYVKKAYAIYPKNPQPLGDLGVINFFFFQIKKDDTYLVESEKYWAKVREIDPRNFLNAERLTLLSQVYYDKASAAEQSGRSDLAAPLLEKSLSFNGNNPKAQNAMGALYARQNKIPEARACFEKAVQLAPNDAQILSDLGLFYAVNGDALKAKETWEKALKIDPNNARAKDGLSQIKFK